ncbi:hypothetical protein [Synechococcus sp. LA31]|uniref:hypothetical protein n=1 Tax=Synechococcus sp. LA31 TaxID=2741953 RepID=UPI001BDBC1CC|nr:hypothetical protein [Synechococcus sp. LA31]QVV67199.1 hypothetical protein KJJ24_12255 [Synechococcus sp. LA31]
MTAPSSSCTHQGWRSGITSAAFTARKQQALVLLLTQQLMDAQFVRADAKSTDRLWREVAALEIDPDRILHLLYCGLDGSDRQSVAEQDDAWIQAHAALQPRGWSLRHLHLGHGLRRPQAALNPA